MKIVKVIGGLGNQLFQWAFSRALEEATGDAVYLDLAAYEYASAHNGFELPRIFPKARFRAADRADVDRLAAHPRGLWGKVRRKYFTKRSHHIDRVFRYDPDVLKLAGDRYVEGWWQTERYFAPVAGLVRDELAFGLDPGSRNVELLGSLRGRGMASVHVRRGDALKNPDTWVCTDHYYKGAFAALREREAEPFFVVFSDDLDWCRSNLGLPEDGAVFVDWNRGEDSWRDLWLMSRCASHVVANSTFSWWGAWLDPSPGKLVLAPGLWSLAKPRPFSYYRYDFTQVVPDSWLRIPISPP